MNDPLDYFGRTIKIDDLIVFPGRVIGQVSHGTVMNVYQIDNYYRISVKKRSDVNNIRTMHLTDLDRCVIMDKEQIKEEFYNED